MTLTTLNSNLDANHGLVNDANPFNSNQLKLVNDANLFTLAKLVTYIYSVQIELISLESFLTLTLFQQKFREINVSTNNSFHSVFVSSMSKNCNLQFYGSTSFSWRKCTKWKKKSENNFSFQLGSIYEKNLQRQFANISTYQKYLPLSHDFTIFRG